MKVEELGKVRKIQVEIKDTIRRKQELQTSMTRVTDVVQGSGKEYPYRKRPIQISGVVMSKQEAARHKSKLEEIQAYLDQKYQELLDQGLAFYRFLDEHIPDYIDRQIFRMHYIDGKTFLQISTRLQRDHDVWLSESGVKLRLHRKLKKLKSVTLCNDEPC